MIDRAQTEVRKVLAQRLSRRILSSEPEVPTMNCQKFEVLSGTEKLGNFYFSGSGDPSSVDKLRIRPRLHLNSSEVVVFRPAGEPIDDSRLPVSPSFCTLEDKIARFWVYPLDEPLPD